MKRLLPISIVLLLLAVPVWGQDGDYPRVEVFGGYSYVEIDVEGGEDEFWLRLCFLCQLVELFIGGV